MFSPIPPRLFFPSQSQVGTLWPLPKNATEAAIDLEFAQQQRKDVYYPEQAENASVKLFIQHCKVARTVVCETGTNANEVQKV